jgi:hypothetical protein
MAEDHLDKLPVAGEQKLSVDDLSDSLKRFGTADYAVFITMLVCCSMVGLYFGYQDHRKHKKSKNQPQGGSEANDYLMGGRNMQVFPVAMSLVASFVSGITLLGETRFNTNELELNSVNGKLSLPLPPYHISVQEQARKFICMERSIVIFSFQS